MTPEQLREIELEVNDLETPIEYSTARETIQKLLTEVKLQQKHISWYAYQYKAKEACIQQLKVQVKDTEKMELKALRERDQCKKIAKGCGHCWPLYKDIQEPKE